MRGWRGSRRRYSCLGSWSRCPSLWLTSGRLHRLRRVSATGGAVTPLTTRDASRQELGHRFPSFLPDGRHFLYHIRSGQMDVRGTYLGSLDGGVKQRLLGEDTNAVYAPPGYLLFG